MNQGDPETLVLFSPWGGRGNGIGNLWTLWFENPYGQLVGGLLAEALAVKALAAAKTLMMSPDQIVAMTWVEEQGLTSPAALREAVDKKHVWKAPVLAKRLRITKEASEFLLARLGYARRPLTETWERSSTFEAKKMRTEWKKAENPFDTKHFRRRSKKRKRRGKTKGGDE